MKPIESARLLPVLALALPSLAGAQPAALPPHVPGELIVQMAPGASALHRQDVLRRARGRVLEELPAPQGQGRGAGLLRLRTELPLEEALRELESDPDVLFAEPDYICWLAATSNDPSYVNGATWGLYGNDQPTASGPSGTTNQYGSQAEKLWAAGSTGSRSVYVGVVDEGMMVDHADLAGNTWTNPFDPVDGLDNDGNGYVDDRRGWDFFNGDASVYDGTSDDHGTHVGGTIGAVGGNGVGVAGVNWRVTIIPLKFIGPDTGRVSDAVKAINYLIDLKTRHGLDVVAINHSWSTSGYSQSLHDAVIRAAKQGILTVAAAGNTAEDNDSVVVYPANFSTLQGTTTQSAATHDGVIAVAAIDRYGALASFSSYGAAKVDLGAPGVAVTSTTPAGYASWSGTSMATPHVTGAIALLKSTRPGALAQELRSTILSTTIATPSLQGKTATGGRLNLSPSATPPGTVHDVAVTVFAPPASLAKGTSVMLPVTVANQGTVAETFSVSVTDAPPFGGTSGAVSGLQSVSLAAGATRTLNFTWITSAASPGAHVLTARASIVGGEADTSDNAIARNVTVVAAGPAISSVTPSSVRAGSSTRVTVRGAGFAPGAKLTFVNGGGPLPTVSSITVAADGQSLTATVYGRTDLYRRTFVWDVRVTNPDGNAGTLVDAFTVKP